jgi:hypothetical protein
VNWPDCLACAASWQNPCSLNFPILQAVYEDSLHVHNWPSVSGIAGCLRKSWLVHTTDYYEYPSGRLALLLGTQMHKMLETGLRALPDFDLGSGEVGALPEIATQWTSQHGHTITGTADLWYQTSDDSGAPLRVLADWKTAKAVYISKLPYGRHEEQINCYAFMLANNELAPQLEVDKLQMIYLAKTGADRKGAHNGIVKVAVDMWPESKTRTFITSALAKLHRAMDDGTPPPMTTQRWECNYCSVKMQCDAIERGD